jgi:hypothetical protein
MPSQDTSHETRVTDSWKAYEECLRAIQRFFAVIEIRAGEAWVGEVCLGSADRPLVRVPLQRDSADLVRQAVGCAETVTADLIRSIHKVAETSRRVIEELKATGEVEAADIDRVIRRIGSLEELLAELARGGSDMPYHPARLLRWSEILRGSLVPGDPAILVRVVTTHVL